MSTLGFLLGLFRLVNTICGTSHDELIVAMLAGTLQDKSEEESSKLSDKSYCVDALLSFEGDGEDCRTNEDFHRSHDSEVTALVSNTAKAAAAAKKAAMVAKEVATSAKEGASSRDPSCEKGSELAFAELAFLLEQATSLESQVRKRRVRSNSFDSKRASSSYFSAERASALYSSAPNLDFFNAFDQDPHLSDTETNDHRGSWWDDSEHTSKINASFSKDFSKIHLTCSRRNDDASAAESTALDTHALQKSEMHMKVSATTEPVHPEFWFDEIESSSERLSHSLHSIRKSEDQRKVKSDGTVTTDFTDMAVVLPCVSLSNLPEKARSKENESDTVATSPATPTVTSRDSAVSSSDEFPGDTNVPIASPATVKNASPSLRTPVRSPKRSSKVSPRGSEAQTPIVSNKKKKVIKVRAGEFDGDMDPAKVQEAVKKWKEAKRQHTSTATENSMGALEGSSNTRATSKSPSDRLEKVGKRGGEEQASKDLSSRSRRSRVTSEVGDSSRTPSARRAVQNHQTESQATSNRSHSKGRRSTTSKQGESVEERLRPRSKSNSPPESSSRQEENAVLSPPVTPRSLSRSKAQQATEVPPAAPLTPTHAPKTLVRKPASPASGAVAQHSQTAVTSAGTGRGRSRPDGPVSPMKTLRSLSMGRGNKARSLSRGGSTRSTFSAIPDSGPARLRSRSLGKIGTALFRRKLHDTDADSELRDAKTAAPGGLFASLTNAVSRSSRPNAKADANVIARPTSSARSKSLPRTRQIEENRARGNGPGNPPTSKPPAANIGPTSSSSSKPPSTPRRSLKNVSTRAVCAGSSSAVRSPTTPPSRTTPAAAPRRQRPIPPQDYIPESIDLSPSSSGGGNPLSWTSSMENNDHSVSVGAATAPACLDRRQLLERAVSDLSDDALFRRIQSAGVTEEMMGRLREAGLIITEAPPPAAVSLSSPAGGRRLSGSYRPDEACSLVTE